MEASLYYKSVRAQRWRFTAGEEQLSVFAANRRVVFIISGVNIGGGAFDWAAAPRQLSQHADNSRPTADKQRSPPYSKYSAARVSLWIVF